jgi:hypothetical protein
MKISRIALATAALSVAAFGAQADEADGSQYALQFNGTKTRAEVQAELASYQKARANPWSIAYNPLNSFRSAKTRAQVTAEYLADRDTVAAMNGEDSGAAYLAQHNATPAVSSVLAGQPVNAH